MSDLVKKMKAVVGLKGVAFKVAFKDYSGARVHNFGKSNIAWRGFY